MFPSTEVFESTTHPGVKFTLKRVGIGMKRKIQQDLAKNELDKNVCVAEILHLSPKDAEGKPMDDISGLPLEEQKRILELNLKHSDLVFEERLEWFKKVVVSIDEPDGTSTSAEEFADHGPEDLFYEIHDQVRKSLGVTDEQAKNSQRPSTSPQVEDGPTAVTSVESADGGTTT